MKLRTIITIIICKTLRFILRFLGRGGTSLPGIIALKLHPKILKDLAKNVDIVLITGTNGKTTIARMIEQCFIEAGLKYFTNKTGANMDTGIAAEFIMNSNIFGKCKYPFAIIECDELAFKKVSRYAPLKTIVVSNIFRDQLDRFGEITHTLNAICEGIENTPDATVCLNSDCSLSVSLKDRIKNNVIFYGLDCPIYKDTKKELSDAIYCIKCHHSYKYNYITYGHLGDFYCEECGYSRPEPTVAVKEIIETEVDSSTVSMKIGDEEYKTTINLPGGYNIYNAAATAAVAYSLGIKNEDTVSALGSFKCGFGRMEKFQLGNNATRMILVKNPAGVNQVLNFLSHVSSPSVFVVGINDKAGDGTDVSWIWDADFEKLLEMGDNLKEVIATGSRAAEMAIRFKYAGIDTDKIKVITDYGKLLGYIAKGDAPAFIMPNYTAMLEIRDKISRDFGYEQYWK